MVSILVAEDNDDDALFIQHAFKQSGLTRSPHIVHDGSGVIAYLRGDGEFTDRATHPFPDMVILDLKMPRVSGFDVLNWLNENPDFRVIPTIIWSSSADRRDVKHAFCLGAHAYLCKPPGFNQLEAMVRRLLAFWEDCEKPGVEPSDPKCHNLKDRKPFSGARIA